MTLTRLSAVEPVPPMVGPYTKWWGFLGEAIVPSAATSATYESADRGVWFPQYVPTVCVAKRMWWINGGTAAGNVEAGIYLDANYKPGAKLVTTGSVAQTGTNVIQFGDLTDTTLTPQLYWLYLSASSATATYFRATTTAASMEELWKMQQASIGPGSAPATATPVEAASTAYYVFGFSTTTIT